MSKRPGPSAPDPAGAVPVEGARRAEILGIAAGLFAESGFAGTSLQDIAAACGILPGSLYHHFDSKQAIAIELLEAYHADLERLAASWQRGATIGQVFPFATAIAECGTRHSAALRLSTYEPHASASPTLVDISRRKPVAIVDVLRRLFESAQAAGELDRGVEANLLAWQLCETLLHIGLDGLYKGAPPGRSATLVTEMLLYGLATAAVPDERLDASAAMLRARESLVSWSTSDEHAAHPRRELLRAAARTEFARRGYETTTIRDIAAASGIGIGAVYRLFDSKEALLRSIMTSFYDKLSAGYRAVALAPAPAVEKLDALCWININAVTHFAAEFEIQRSWFRALPPEPDSLADAREARARYLRNVVAQGLRDGEFRFPGVAADALVPCVRDLAWPRPSVLSLTDAAGALHHERAAFLRGAATGRM